MSTFSNRSQQIKPFYVMSILEKAQRLQADGQDIIHLEVGEPDFPTPGAIAEAGIRAIQDGHTKYTPALGLPALREAIARDYDTRFGVSVSPDRIVITPGASGALLLLAAARLNIGDTLLLADPGYPCNRHFANLFEAHGHLIPCDQSVRYQLTPELIKRHWRSDSKGALVASPANPTGVQLSLEELESINRTCHSLGGDFWVDEIYQGLNFSQDTMTVLQVAPDAAVINSFSKFFGMTGWRLGWVVVPEDWVPTLDTLAQNIFLAAPTTAQYAALAAYSAEVMDELEQRRQALKQRRDYLLDALPKLGFNVPVAPDGAFYIYVDASRFTDNSLEFCQQILEKTGVALTPGIDFGDFAAQHHIRIAFTTSLERLEEAITRLQHYLSSF